MLLIRFIFIVLSAAAATTLHAQEVDKAAEVNGVPITVGVVDAKLGNSLAQLQQQIFSLRQKQLETMIDQKLLEDESAKRGITIAALVRAEITSRVTPATSEDAAKFFQENGAKLKGDLKSLEEQIKNFLTAQRVQVRQQEFLKSLRANGKVDVFLKAPPVFHAEVTVDGAPVRGDANAPVTIIEFSDFHCPFCRKVTPVLDDLRAKYGPKIKIVYRDFPLGSLHPHARSAAEASHCATEQGKFWEFHDRLFKSDPGTSQAMLNQVAQEIGMDVTAFEACSSSGKYKTAVQASAEEGTKLGVTGTPTFFINGRILTGAQPADSFARIIDEELAVTRQQAVETRISIQREPKANQVLHVTTTQELSISPEGSTVAAGSAAGQIATETVLGYTQANGRFDDQGRMESYLTIERIDMKQAVDGTTKPPGNLTQLLGRSVTAVFDRSGKLVDLKVPQDLQQTSPVLKQLVAGANGPWNFLPAAAMSVGETETTPSTIPLRIPGGTTPVPYQTRTVTKLRAVDKSGNDRVAHFEQRIESAAETDLMKVNGTGTIDVNLDRGFVTASTTEWTFGGGTGTPINSATAQPGAVQGTIKVTMAANE